MSPESRTVEVNLIKRRHQSEKNNYCFGLRTGCAIGVCTNQHDHDRRNHNGDKTVDRNANNYEHNLRDGHGNVHMSLARRLSSGASRAR